MNQLVFLEPNKIDAVPFTTSKVVADLTGVSHRYVKKQITQRANELKQFGLLVAHATESTGGRPEEIICLNEEQATLLITFMKNTPVVIAFKTELVRQFFAMREELMKRRGYRAELKPIRHDMTDTIQICEPDNKWAYKQYTDLAYKMAIGKSAAQLRKERNAPPKAVAVDYMTSEEIHSVAEMQNSIDVLLRLGMNYYQVKGMLAGATLKRIA